MALLCAKGALPLLLLDIIFFLFSFLKQSDLDRSFLIAMGYPMVAGSATLSVYFADGTQTPLGIPSL